MADFRPALRDVARCCLHGVDKNPMAVELTRVALWIETVTPGLPLGFLDGQIRCGDALLGLVDLSVLENGIPDAAYKPLTGDHKATANHYKKANRAAKQGQIELDLGSGAAILPAMQPLALAFSRLRNLGEDTVGQISQKASRFRDLRQTPEFQRARAAADLYVAAFLLPKTGAAPAAHSRTVPTTDELQQALAGHEPPALGTARQAAADARAFHWPLEFPDVMEQGGFDVVLGNPPWERIKLQEQEFFASRSDEIADAPNKAARDRLIKVLATEPIGSARRGLWDAFVQAKRLSEAVSEFVHVPGGDGGRFPFTGRGDVNTYALFAELVANLSSARAGAIVPTGVATDATTAPFFAHLVEKERLARLVDFENRAGLFPGVHRSFKFCLLTMGQREPAARFAFFLTDPAQLAVSQRSFTLSPRQIAAINPNTRTAPVFRSRQDGELTAKIYGKVPVLMEESRGAQGNPWGLCFASLFHMSNDSHLFRTAAALSAGGWVRNGTGWVAEGANSNVAPGPADGDGPSLNPAPEPQRVHRYVPLY
ncbi:MAG: restriction endonuclease, partial [Synechococcus sp. SB0672_bin_6]|nr:restriction endonuclease [Synechococcus sp. SB0672_bin_6]